MFSALVRVLMDDETYRSLQNELVQAPEKGTVMPGCGGLRKIRVEAPARGKGNRGGNRVIYLHIPEANRIDFLAIYSKNERDDLDAGQKRKLTALATLARTEALRMSAEKRK